MKTKYFLFVLLSCLPLLRLSAQISELEQVLHAPNDDYIHYTSIVRNYNDSINVLMKYGHFVNEVAPDSSIGSCVFMIQNTNTGVINRIVKLPKGYQVNDIRFLTLRKIDGQLKENFCCFCGTRTQFEGIHALPNPGGGPNYYIDVYSKHGFVGFFSMEEALNPSTSYTAKVRDVENTKELYRMTCYAEKFGYYYNEQNTFIDNAVLDIIGIDDTVNKPSCFCRVKFYPASPLGIRWDNNMRLNNTETLTDITGTDDYVATVSHNTTSSDLCIRYSDKEDHLFYGGMQLNDYVNSLDFSSGSVLESCDMTHNIGPFNRFGNAKICNTTGNGTAIGFHMGNLAYEGAMECMYEYSNGTLFISTGAYLKGNPLIKEMMYLPENGATALLYNESTDYVSVWNWKIDANCYFPVKQFYRNDINAQSISLQIRNGYEHLLWSGKKTSSTFSNLYLMTQRGSIGGGDNTSCHNTNKQNAFQVSIDHDIVEERMRIAFRYPHNNERYPVSYISFLPYEIEKVFHCQE